MSRFRPQNERLETSSTASPALTIPTFERDIYSVSFLCIITDYTPQTLYMSFHCTRLKIQQ